MATPTVQDTTTSSDNTVNSDDRDVTLPATVDSGDLLIMYLFVRGQGGNTTVDSWPTGWVELANEQSQNTVIGIAYKDADGTEDGSTVVVTLTNSTVDDSSATVYRITGHEDPSTQAPEVSSSANGFNDDPNPPSLTPTGGAKDYLWIASFSQATADCGGGITYPTNYSNGVCSGTNSAVHGGTAERALNASSENPGAFVSATTARWLARTLAVHPGSGAAPATFKPKVVIY